MSEKKQYCMVMKINVDCNACCRKLRRIILGMKAIETHLIEKERYRVIVFGRFTPADVAIKIRKRMNRRVEILDVEEMEPNPPAAVADQSQPEQNHIQQPPAFPGGVSMFPSVELDNRRPIFPSLVANECRSFSSSHPDFTVTCFPEPEKFWHYYGLELAGDTDSDSNYYAHNPNYY